uniref:Uncharacterized protein n=1 Tax=Romanomermis culicivorax TaxID=13658 RepID=A0A915IBQ2_ROMCU
MFQITVHKPVNRLLAENPKDEDRATKKRMRQTSSKPMDASPMKTLEPPLKRVKRASTNRAADSPKIALLKVEQKDETENLSKQKDVAKPVVVSPAPFKVEQILNRYRQLTLAHRAKMAAAKQSTVTPSPKLQNLSKSDKKSRKSSVDNSVETTASKNDAKVGKTRRNSVPLPVKTLLQKRSLGKSMEKTIPVAVVPPAKSPKMLEKQEQAKADSPVKNDVKKIPINEEKIATEEKVDDVEDDEQ